MKKIISLFLILFIFTQTGCTNKETVSSRHEEIPYTIPDMSGYRNMEGKEHNFREITLESLVELFRQKETFYIWMSKTDCIYCQNAVWILNDAALEAGASVYYLDTGRPLENMTVEEFYTLYDELCGYMRDACLVDNDGSLALYAPMIANIQNGQLIKHHVSLTDSYSAAESDTLNEEEVKELYAIYQEVLK